jgi:plastocyanin
MRRVAAVAATLLLAGLAVPASASDQSVSVANFAFSPSGVTVAQGESVTWRFDGPDTNHSVTADAGQAESFDSDPGNPFPSHTVSDTFDHTFNTAGTYRYHDALHPALTGKVVVSGPPPAVTIGAATPIILYGQTTQIAGQVSNLQANEKVDVYAQPYGAASAQLIASLLTGANGVWAVSVKPALATTYSAHWKSLVSSTVSVGVRPAISFTIGRHQRAAVKVKAATSHAGRKVYIQRFTRFHEWVKFRVVKLGPSSGRVFRFHLKRGRYTLRAYMTINQAGVGYLDGISRTVVLRVR